MGIEVYEKTLRRLATKSDSVALGPFEVETAAAAGRVDSYLYLTHISKNSQKTRGELSTWYTGREEECM